DVGVRAEGAVLPAAADPRRPQPADPSGEDVVAGHVHEGVRIRRARRRLTGRTVQERRDGIALDGLERAEGAVAAAAPALGDAFVVGPADLLVEDESRVHVAEGRALRRGVRGSSHGVVDEGAPAARRRSTVTASRRLSPAGWQVRSPPLPQRSVTAAAKRSWISRKKTRSGATSRKTGVTKRTESPSSAAVPDSNGWIRRSPSSEALRVGRPQSALQCGPNGVA